MKYKTVVKVMEPVLDDEGNQVDQDGEPMDGAQNPKKEQTAVWDEILYYLLHWGLTYEILIGKDGDRFPVSYTVGICQHIKSGVIKSFVPQELIVVGKEVT